MSTVAGQLRTGNVGNVMGGMGQVMSTAATTSGYMNAALDKGKAICFQANRAAAARGDGNIWKLVEEVRLLFGQPGRSPSM